MDLTVFYIFYRYQASIAARRFHTIFCQKDTRIIEDRSFLIVCGDIRNFHLFDIFGSANEGGTYCGLGYFPVLPVREILGRDSI